MSNGKTIRDAMKAAKQSPAKPDPFKHDVIEDPMGQWKYPGQITKIPSGNITMQGVPYPVYGKDDLGNGQMMYPGMDYQFPGQYVTEYPQIAKYGGGLLNKTLTCPKCGWSWKAVDGGKDIATCHKCGGTAKLAYGGLHKAQKGEQIEDNDSWLENIAEIVDPTGISSWDDVYRAYKNTGLSGETVLEALGAIPLLGKIGKSGKVIAGGFGLLQDAVKASKYLPTSKQQKFIDKAFDTYQKYNKAGGKELDEALGSTTKILKDKIPYINPTKWSSSDKAINVANKAFKTGRISDAVQAALGSKDNSGFTWDMRHGEVPMYNGRNIFPQIQLGEHGDFAYGGDPSLPAITGHYPFGGQNTKTHTHMQEGGGWLDQYQDGGEKPWGEMTYAEKKAYLDAKEKQKPVTKAQADAWAKKAQQKSTEQAKKEHYQEYVQKSMEDFYKHPITNAPGLAFGTVFPAAGLMASLPLLYESGKNITKGDASAMDYANVALTLAGVKNLVPSSVVKRLGRDVVHTLDNMYVTPIQFRKDIKAIKDLASKQHEVFKNPVVEQKLKDLGIDPTLLQNPDVHSNIGFVSGAGSAYWPGMDHMNIDLRQIKRLKKQGLNLTPAQVYEHELGHKIQQKAWYSSPEYKDWKKASELYKTSKDKTDPLLYYKANLAGPKSIETKLDDLMRSESNLGLSISDEALADDNVYHSFTHFMDPKEKLAYMREMRQGMIEKGIIPNQFEPITKKHIVDYVRSTPNDRIASFMDKTDIFNYSKLRDAFKMLPAVVPIGLGIGAIQNKKNGGWLDELAHGGPFTPKALRKKVQKKGTKKNIQSSINEIFTRNWTVFGSSGKGVYNPNSKYQTGGNWLDNLE